MKSGIFRILAVSLCGMAASLAPLMAGVIDRGAAAKTLNNAEQAKGNPQLLLARQLMASQDYQAAADILEVLYEDDPTNTIVSNSLKSCYEQLKQYAKGELLLRRLLEQFPSNVSYQINLADNLVHQGKIEEGKSLYNDILSNLRPDNSSMLASVVRSMIEGDLDDEALKVIEKLRLQLGNPTLMAVEKAGILEQKRKYDAATVEYLGVLKDSTSIGNTAEKGLQALLEFEESSISTERALISRINSDSSGRALKVLSTYYLKSGQYDKAFEFAVRHDSVTGFSGVSLIQYLRSCMERRLYLPAIRVSEYVIANLKDKPFAGEFYYRYAESLEELGDFNRAINVYDTIFTFFPRPQDQAEAVYQIGRIYLERLNNPQVALQYFDSVINNYQLGFAYNSARISIPQAYLRMGDLERSRQEFERLIAQRHNSETSEELAFHLALLDLFEHKYDSCSRAIKKLMVDYPQGFYINDAVQLSFVINQAGEDHELLNSYADACLFQKMKLYDSTVSRLISIADAENKALADIALIRLTEIVLQSGDSAGAVKFVDRMEAEHAESYYLPYALKTKADVLQTRKDLLPQAKEIYRRLLENYPNYPFINEVRERLRELESVARPS